MWGFGNVVFGVRRGPKLNRSRVRVCSAWDSDLALRALQFRAWLVSGVGFNLESLQAYSVQRSKLGQLDPVRV